MHLITVEHHNQRNTFSLKTENQFKPRRRDNGKRQVFYNAVREWEQVLPGQAQERIAQLVAAQWEKMQGKGITVNKQNLFRYLKNETASDKYNSYVMQLAPAIAQAMPIEIARKYGLRKGMTEAELVAQAIKECSEAHQAKLLGAPLQKLEKEVREAAVSLFNMLPAEAVAPLLASLSAVTQQLF
ncbi:toxin YdaT domain-containing protein [Enterobacteriaceae bacterium H20N1]|uniref:Toxin YdaT domain-containing protein n=1 Tax=Dryocola boscaweniae TaxID=2925397 RepID=A0A9X2W6P6_9ENTR|nr:toxin YdaT family protein [Dryocola boscaweniae]MCT4701187.1 toxin YdaT domain-containing protein [Dryocola boscaweniae]MCT4718308.1 toxin YdaT domain-containing protein [Dryocola boscaweniae]